MTAAVHHHTGTPDTKDLRQHHMQMIRNLLLREDSLTVKAISQKIGLSIVTVGALLQQMSSYGELLPARRLPSEGGRPAYCYSYDLSFAYALVLNAFHVAHGMNNITIQVVNLKGRIIHNDRRVVQDVDIEVFDTIIDDMLVRFPAIRTLGFVLPGEEFRGVVTCGDFEALNGIPFSEHMMERYGLPVYFDNDVNAAVQGFCAKQHMFDSSVVYLFFPEGFPPGGGVFLKGEVYSGASNFVGEFGFLPFDIDWKHVGKKTFREYLHILVPTICCLYNPDILVLNGNLVDKDCVGELNEHCAKILPPSSIPEFAISADFLWDISEGAISGVLGLLNRPETFCKE